MSTDSKPNLIMTNTGQLLLTLITSIFIYLLFELPVFLMLFYHYKIETFLLFLSHRLPLPPIFLHSMLLAIFYLTIFNLFNFFYLGRCQTANRYKLLRDNLICSLTLSFGQCFLIIIFQGVSPSELFPYWTFNISLIVLTQIVFVFVASLTTIYYQMCYDQSTKEFRMKHMLKREQKKIGKMLAMLVQKRQIYASQIGRFEALMATKLALAAEIGSNIANNGGGNGVDSQKQQIQIDNEIKVIGRRLNYYRKYYRTIEIGIGVYERKYRSLDAKLMELANNIITNNGQNKPKQKQVNDNRLEF